MIALLIAAVAAASQAAPAPSPRSAPALPSPATDEAVAAQIRRLEQIWGQAFVRRDYALIERLIAPEFRLAGMSPEGRANLVLRGEWMRNTRSFEVSAFAVDIVDVMTAGDTAVALVEGRWTVRRGPDRPFQTHRFVVTDTWVRRGGRWQVVSRYSQRLPEAASPPAPQGAAAAGAPPRP